MGLPKINFQPQQVALIRRTVAKDANENEFNLYMEMCKARGLNPLRRHCYCLVMHKDKANKRQMVIVVSIDGQRHIAERGGCYRPDEQAPRFVADESAKDNATNPAGLISAEVSVYKFSHGQWFPVPGVAYWEEAAPIKEIWEGDKPTGRFELDKKKDNWRRMPRLMLAKVAEMMALRKAFPDDFSGLYGEAEMDRGEVLDITPSEMAEQAEQTDRMNKIGGGGKLIVDWMDGGMLDSVPIGQFFDRAAAFIASRPAEAGSWAERNRNSLKEFWALRKDDALALKKAIEAAIADPDAALSGQALADKLCEDISGEMDGDKRDGILSVAQDARDDKRLSPDLYFTVLAAYHAASGDDDTGEHELKANDADVRHDDPMFAGVMA